MYTVYHRSWWRDNPDWPNGREPHAGPRTVIARHVATEQEARAICAQWNATHSGRFALSRKAEYEED